METTATISETRSTADVVFDRLHEEIATLSILPGTKISEADIARRFGVSRQPARDAFRRLHNLDLLEIRPQRATVVRRFSLAEIENTRFVRLAIELEVMERACQIWGPPHIDKLAENLAQQSASLRVGDADLFHELDYDFHKSICGLSQLPMAFETIRKCKRNVDRLCVLSLSNKESVADVLADHLAIADALSRRSIEDLRRLTRQHVSRLDATIAEIHQTHTNYFQ
jgi:DNA-binding GntR family transcriptional regulator